MAGWLTLDSVFALLVGQIPSIVKNVPIAYFAESSRPERTSFAYQILILAPTRRAAWIF